MSLYFDRKYGKRESMQIMRMLVADVGVGLRVPSMPRSVAELGGS